MDESKKDVRLNKTYIILKNQNPYKDLNSTIEACHFHKKNIKNSTMFY